MIQFEESIETNIKGNENLKKEFANCRKAFIKDYSKSKNELVRLMGKYTSEEYIPGLKCTDTLKKTVNYLTQLKSAMGIPDKVDDSKKP